jgi:predicted transcriptional regulator
MTNVSDLEMRVLEVLVDNDEWCLPFDAISQYSGVERPRIRRIVRSLARKGLAELKHGLMDDDGKTAGSGYTSTPAGKSRFEWELQQIEKGKHVND